MWRYRNPVEVRFGAGTFDGLGKELADRAYCLVTYDDANGGGTFAELTRRVIAMAGEPAALVRNIARARRTLGVERPTQNYVVIRFIPRIETEPTVNIYVSNEFGESGYLATTMDGTVNQSHPFRG